MPTAQDLDRLRALVAQLKQIGSVQTGELIRATDWNTLAAAIADLARTVLATEADSTVPAHTHLDQVGLDWFTPSVRDLIQRGPLADPATQNRLTGIEQKLTRYGSQLDSTTQTVESFRGRLTDVATNDLARQSALTGVQRSLNNVIDPRPDIAAMRASLDAVQGNLSAVQEAAAKLTVNGQILDAGALANSITSLEGFRDSFKSATGQILDAATIENELADIKGRIVTKDELTQAFKDHPLTIPPEEITGLETRLGTTLRDQFNGQLQAIQTQIQGSVDKRLNSVGDLVTSRLNEATPGITQTVTNSLSPKIDAAQQAATNAANANTQTVVAAREQSILANVNDQIAALNAGVAASVTSQVTQQINAALQTVRASVDTATARIDILTQTLTKQGATLDQNSAALAAVPQTLASLKNDLQQSVLNEINLQVAAINRSIDDRFSQFQKLQSDQIATLTNTLLAKATDVATEVATKAANNAAALLRAQLAADMQTVARAQATAILNDQVKMLVTSTVKDQLAGLPSLVASEVRRVTRPVATDPAIITTGVR
jgi:hypothetical protein